MIHILKQNYRGTKSFISKLHFYYSINWTKTLYFNLKKFPFDTAVKLPVYFYGSVKFSDISGKIVIDANVKRGMIGFGQTYEMFTRSNGTAEIVLKGTIIFKGHVQFGKDYFIYVAQGAYCEMGHMSSLGRSGKIICRNNIKLGKYARLGSESQIIDTGFHQMIDTLTNEKFPISGPIVIGDFNYIANRVSIMQKTITPDFCTIASNSLCNRDFSEYGQNILIGGIPAKLIRKNIARDWEGEKHHLENLIV